MKVGTLMFDEQEEIRTLLDCVAFNPTERAYANTIAAEWEDSLLSLVTHVKLSVRAGQSIVDHKEVK